MQPPSLKSAPVPQGPPDLVIDSISPKVGFERQNFQFPDGRPKLAAALQQNRAHLEGKPAVLIIDRKAKQAWVAAYLAELAKIGVPEVRVRTETRSDFPAEVSFTPESRLTQSPACSPVVMIMEDRATAVWKLSGGAAARRPKGLAGPDLSMTGDTIERIAKACKSASPLFVGATPAVDWGLIYDLAASTKSLDARFETIGFLGTPPVAGHKVTLTP